MGKNKKKKKSQEKKQEQVPVSTPPVSSPPPAILRSNKKLWILLFAILVVLSVAVFYFKTRGQNYAFGSFKDYNVLLITLDTTRADHLPIYGYKQGETPSLDKIGKSSLIFEDAITQAPLTLPSHTSIMTGTMPIWHGVRDNAGYFLDPKVKTLATILKSKSYHTAAFVSAFTLDSRSQINQGFDLYFDHFSVFHLHSDQTQRKAQDTEAEFSEWLPDVKDKRFFCWVHFYDPHQPYDPPEPFKSKYAGHLYDGEIAYMDQYIGKLMDRLEELHLADRTLVILVGDHGEGLGQHEEDTHCTFLYNTTLHVPFLIHAPHGSHKKIPGVVRLVDIAPTILELLGFQPLPEMQGKSLIPLINGTEKAERTAFSDTIFAQLHYGWSPLKSLTTDRYKYIDAPKPELYDRKEDPDEMHNLYNSKPALAKVLKDQVTQITNSFSRSDTAAGPAKVDPETEEKLRALGYIGATVKSTVESLKVDPKDKARVIRSVNEAFEQMEMKNYQKALQLILPIIQSDPEIPDGHYIAGSAYLSLQQYDNALDEFLKSQAIRPYAEIMGNIGWIYETKGNFREAEHWYLKVLEQQKNDPFANSKLAGLYRQMNQPDKAEVYLEKTVAPLEESVKFTKDPVEQAKFHALLAQFYFEADRLDEAEENLKAAIELKPQAPDLHFFLGQVYEGKNDLQNAALNYKQELVIQPANLDANANLGILYMNANHPELAIPCFHKILELRPGNPRASFLLAQAYMETGNNLEDAVQLLQSGLAKRPDYKNGYLLLAEVYKKLGRDKEAAQALAASQQK